MLIGYGIPPASVALVGGTWLTDDGGAALFDGRPARRARIARTGALAINITLAEAIVPGIIAVLGLNVPPGVLVTAAGASATTIRLPDGSVCAWLFPTGNALVSAVAVTIATVVTNIDVGEIAVFSAVTSEFVNTIIESVVDLIVEHKFHPLAKVAKDVAAGGVLIAVFFEILVLVIIFQPYFYEWMGWPPLHFFHREYFG